MNQDTGLFGAILLTTGTILGFFILPEIFEKGIFSITLFFIADFGAFLFWIMFLIGTKKNDSGRI